MESVTGRRSVLTAMFSGWGRTGWLGFGAGTAALLGLIAIDLAIGRTAVLVGPFVIVPFVTALFAGLAPTLAVGILAIAAGAVSGAWNMNFGDTAYDIRLVVLAAGTVFACLSAWNRELSRVRGERLRVLDAVSEIADGSRPLDETLRRVSELIVPAAADMCTIDAVHGGKVTRAAIRVAGHPRGDEIERRVGAGVSTVPSWLLEGDEKWRKIPRWRPRVTEEDLRRMARSPADLDFLISLGVCSLLIVPVASRDRNLGVLTMFSAWSRRHYTEDDVHFAQILASRIGLALDNAGLFSDLESVERRMDTVMSILDEAVVIHDRDGDIVFANPAAARTMGFETPEDLISAPTAVRDRYSVRDEQGRELGPEALAGGRAPTGDASATAIVRVTGPDSVERWYRTNAKAIEGPDGLPLYSVTVIEDVTDVKRAEFAQRLLARTGELLANSTDYRRTLEQVASLVVPEFADWCAVSLPGDDGSVDQVAVAHADPERARFVRELQLRYAQRLDAEGGVAEVIRTGEAQLIEEVSEEMLRQVAVDDEHLRLLREIGIGAAIMAPMTAGSVVVGALALVNDESGRTFDAEDLELAVEVANRAGVAIESARLASARAGVTKALQRELLPPSLPDTPGWEVATMYRPAGEVNDVGGDFYEAFELDGEWALVLGDVSGRGAKAAAVTGEARHTIRTAAALSPDPVAGLRLLDERLSERSDAALCSIAVLLLPEQDSESVQARLWLAGHPPLLLVRDGEVSEVGEPGPMVGLGEGAGWVASEVTLLHGDQLVVYTDGVIEARRESGERFGVDRLRDRLAGCKDPQGVVESVESALEEFVPEEVEDDAAVVAVRRIPVSSVVRVADRGVAGAHGRSARATGAGGIGEPVTGGTAG